MVLAQGLRSNQGLNALSLASNRIGPEGAAALASALESHPNLVELDLGYDRSTRVLGEDSNRLGDAGAAEIARLIRNNRKLKSVNLTRNRISDGGAVLLLAALERNNELVELKIGKGISAPIRNRLHELLERNRRQHSDLPQIDEDISAIRSIYRTFEQVVVLMTHPGGKMVACSSPKHSRERLHQAGLQPATFRNLVKKCIISV